ncbi:unnamed protein product [Rhodiola kirilowii]
MDPEETTDGPGPGGRPVSSNGFVDMSRGLRRRPNGALARTLAAMHNSQTAVPINASAIPSPTAVIPPLRPATFIYTLPTDENPHSNVAATTPTVRTAAAPRVIPSDPRPLPLGQQVRRPRGSRSTSHSPSTPAPYIPAPPSPIVPSPQPHYAHHMPIYTELDTDGADAVFNQIFGVGEAYVPDSQRQTHERLPTGIYERPSPIHSPGSSHHTPARSEPYPEHHRDPLVHGESSAAAAARVSEPHDPPRVFITPVGDENFDPHDIVFDIGLKCIGKKFEAGWTTISTVPQWARERWFEEFQRLATWNPQLTPLVYRIFMKKCGKILRDGWHNLRAGRSTEGPVFSNPAATVKAIAKFKIDSKLKALSDRNKISRRGKKDNPSRHSGGRYPPFVHRDKLSIILKRTVYCNDMYKRLKIGKDGTYLDKDGATIESDLEATFRALQERFNGEIPEAEDLEASAPILGYSQRTGLPRVIGSAATLVIGSRFQAMSTQGNLNSQTTAQSQGLSQDAIALLTKMSQQFEDLRRVVEQQAHQLQKLKGVASSSSVHSLDEVSSDEESE